MSNEQIQYSEKYFDDVFEYRHVILPTELAKLVPKCHLMTESEWRNLGIQQSPGWIHYMMHAPEPHVILFRRPRTDFNKSNSFSVITNSIQDSQNQIDKNPVVQLAN